MVRESTLRRILYLHVVLVLATALVFPQRSSGVMLGGAAIAGATMAFWAMARGLAGGVRRSWLAAVATLKIVAYMILVAAAFSGAFSIDELGFAIGVALFTLAVVTVSLLCASGSRWGTDSGWSTDSAGLE